MSDVAEYQVFVCALFPVQGGMWTDYFSAYNFRLIYDIQLVHLLVCNIQCTIIFDNNNLTGSTHWALTSGARSVMLCMEISITALWEYKQQVLKYEWMDGRYF